MVKLRALLIDLSGTLHVGDAPSEGAVESLRQLREAGIAVRFVCNSSKASKRAILSRMKRIGLDVREDELFSAMGEIERVVKDRKLNPLYLLSPAALEDLPPSHAPFDSVVVGLAPDRLNCHDMNEAYTLLLSEGEEKPAVPLITIHKALSRRANNGRMALGAGLFIKGLEDASGVQAEVLGKPTLNFYKRVLASLEKDGIESSCWGSAVGITGDDKKQDVGAVTVELGFWRALVRTGKYRPGDEGKTEAGRPPDWVGSNFSEAVKEILSER